MKHCPKCNIDVPDEDWCCPKCGYHFPTTIVGTNHATSGYINKSDDKILVSKEDQAIIKDVNHSQSDIDEDSTGYDAEQPYTSNFHHDEDD